MKQADKKRIAQLRGLAPTCFKVLRPAKREDFYIAEIEFTCYVELMCTISDLLKLCINAECYEAEGASPHIKGNPSIGGILELTLQLIPIDEAELLDEIRPVLERNGKEDQSSIQQ